jgi:hypothetical protein
MTPSIAPPHELAEMKCWLVWRFVHKADKKKPLKVPFYVNGNPRGQQNTEEDRAQLVTYAQARAALDAQGWDGVGFAVLQGGGVVVLDFDDCVVDGVIAAHVEALCDSTYTEFSPSGNGVHAFFIGTLTSRKDVDCKRGAFPVEVFGNNGFVTFTGRATETCTLFGYEGTIAPLTAVVTDMYAARGWDSNQVDVPASMHGLMALQPTQDMSLADVAETLQKVSPDIGYEDWYKVGAGIHQQTHASEDGFEIWNRWSAQSGKYAGEKDLRSHWDSFGNYASGRMLTFAFVVRLAKEAEANEKYKALDELKKRVDECNDMPTLKERVCAEISRDLRIGALEREELAQALVAKTAKLGTKLPIKMCRKLVAPAPSERGTNSESPRPEWLQGYLYVTEQDKFHRYDSDEWLTQTAFNAKFNRFMPRGEGGRPMMPAAQCALEDYCIETVTRGMYLPWANSDATGLFEMDGVHLVNTYRRSSVPIAADEYTAGGREAIRLFVQHIYLMCTGRVAVAEHVLSWLAFCVQHPGVKIRHAILIKGIEGDGKSLIGNVMGMVMGQPNVKQISPKVLGTDFNDWAAGACLGVMEELKLTGHNRYDVMNALKPMITNEKIPLHGKGKAEVNVVNTMNYLAFTNHGDSLPLRDDDRRWTTIFTKHRDRDDLQRTLAALGFTSIGAYFTALHDSVSAHPAELRKWFLERDLLTFDPNDAAPMTDEKMQMVRMSESPEEEVIREILEARGDGVGENILSSTCLLDQVQLGDTDVSLQTSVINRILTRMGWAKVPRRVKWRGRAHRIWFRGDEPSDVQRALDETVKTSTGDAAPASLGDVSELF